MARWAGSSQRGAWTGLGIAVHRPALRYPHHLAVDLRPLPPGARARHLALAVTTPSHAETQRVSKVAGRLPPAGGAGTGFSRGVWFDVLCLGAQYCSSGTPHCGNSGVERSRAGRRSGRHRGRLHLERVAFSYRAGREGLAAKASPEPVTERPGSSPMFGRFALSFSVLPGTHWLDEEPYRLWLIPGEHRIFFLESTGRHENEDK